MYTTPQIIDFDKCCIIDDLLCKIDQGVTQLTINQLNNLSYEVDLPYDTSQIKSLIYYKTILTKRKFNGSYACEIQLDDIISHTQLLLNKYGL